MMSSENMEKSKSSKHGYMEMSDEHLADLCAKRDGSAIEEIMRRYMRQIFNFSRQYVKTIEDAEDVTQDTFFKVWKYIRHYTRGRQFRPWLYTIARNTALDLIKRKKAIVFSDLDDDTNDLQFVDTIEDTEPLPPELFENTAMASKLDEALINIHPDHRAILMMHYKDEMTFDEIASIVNKPMNTVKSWHRRALLKLRTLLSHHYTK